MYQLDTWLNCSSIPLDEYLSRRSKRSSSGDREESKIKLEWVTNGEEMKITFENGNTDTIMLAKVSDFHENYEDDNLHDEDD